MPPLHPPTEFFLHTDSNRCTTHITSQLGIPQWLPHPKYQTVHSVAGHAAPFVTRSWLFLPLSCLHIGDPHQVEVPGPTMPLYVCLILHRLSPLPRPSSHPVFLKPFPPNVRKISAWLCALTAPLAIPGFPVVGELFIYFLIRLPGCRLELTL